MEFREGAFDFQTSQQNRKFIPEDFQNLQLENMRLEDLFRLADDDKYRFEVLKIKKNELLNKLYPENAIKAHFGDANHMY
ncbi:hypothetical protein B1148_00350, partial [Enterococcus faecium]